MDVASSRPVSVRRRAPASARLRNLVRQIHTYIGLLGFIVLLIYGIAGIDATLNPHVEGQEAPFKFARFEPFQAPPGATDQQIQDLVYKRLGPPLAEPEPAWAFTRDAAGNLRFTYYSINSVTRATVLEKENRLRIESREIGFWRFINNAHAVTAGYKTRFALIRLWGTYNQFVMFSMLALAISGLYLWLASRPRYRPAHVVLAAGSAAFVLFYFAIR